MKVYVNYSWGGFPEIYWTEAARNEENGDPLDGEIAPIENAVDEYFKYRAYKEPSAEDALLFLISEIGEMIDAYMEKPDVPLSMRALVFNNVIGAGKAADDLLSEKQGWVRNNDRIKISDLSDEVGDVQMMLVKFASKLNIDPIEAMFEKMEKKGWKR